MTEPIYLKISRDIRGMYTVEGNDVDGEPNFDFEHFDILDVAVAIQNHVFETFADEEPSTPDDDKRLALQELRLIDDLFAEEDK